MLTSNQNPKVKEAKRLWKRRERESTQRFLIEGFRELSRATSVEIETLFICPDLFLGENESDLIARIKAPVYPCSESVFRSLSYRDRPDGLLAVAKQSHLTLASLKPSARPFYVIAEAIEKPGNLGTILRSSDATGVDAVIVCDKCTDIHNPNVVRASVGTLFTQPVVEAGGEETLQWLREQNIALLAATPSAKKEFTDVDLTQGVAIVVGTEQYGLTKRWMEGADLQVKIPMQGVADSLNVAMATTLLLYEVIRQRRHGS
ncbi:MAG: 23S rRNA (uridine(2479)-2'-O)-methyltransferase [Chlamydiales bacterium]|nr:23S rRNA (uridine(2479)-2'-O)-methyltransferase [Chlamydiales bacterium]